MVKCIQFAAYDCTRCQKKSIYCNIQKENNNTSKSVPKCNYHNIKYVFDLIHCRVGDGRRIPGRLRREVSGGTEVAEPGHTRAASNRLSSGTRRATRHNNFFFNIDENRKTTRFWRPICRHNTKRSTDLTLRDSH